MNYEVTVIIPVKDRVGLLEQTIDSLRSQHYENWRAILVDDGSGGESAAAIEIIAKSDGRLKLISRVGDRRGPSVCRNQGALLASSELIMFLDSDDLLTPQALGRRVAVMNRNLDADFCLFSSCTFYDDPSVTSPWTVDWNGASDLDRLLRREWPLNVSSAIWRLSYFLNNGLFDEELPSWEDWELHVRVLAKNPKYLRYIENDILIRASRNHARVSSAQYKESIHLEAAAELFHRIASMLNNCGLLSDDRYNLMLELVFGNAYLSLLVDGPRTALQRYAQFRRLTPIRGRYYLNLARLLWCVMKYRAGALWWRSLRDGPARPNN